MRSVSSTSLLTAENKPVPTWKQFLNSIESAIKKEEIHTAMHRSLLLDAMDRFEGQAGQFFDEEDKKKISELRERIQRLPTLSTIPGIGYSVLEQAIGVPRLKQ